MMIVVVSKYLGWELQKKPTYCCEPFSWFSWRKIWFHYPPLITFQMNCNVAWNKIDFKLRSPSYNDLGQAVIFPNWHWYQQPWNNEEQRRLINGHGDSNLILLFCRLHHQAPSSAHYQDREKVNHTASRMSLLKKARGRKVSASPLSGGRIPPRARSGFMWKAFFQTVKHSECWKKVSGGREYLFEIFDTKPGWRLHQAENSSAVLCWSEKYLLRFFKNCGHKSWYLPLLSNNL